MSVRTTMTHDGTDQRLQDVELKGSEAPEICLNGVPVMLGIDEAGRGPVMGPMVYGTAYWRIQDNDEMSALGFDDSKALSAESREGLFDKINANQRLGWMVRLISASEISDKMQRQTSNLNEIARDATIQLIKEVQRKGVNVKQVFVDTVGDPKWYQTFLTKYFNGTIEFRVEKKADSLFKVVSAASICAKVVRDKVITDWEWESPALTLSKEFGSGYPSDPRAKTWMTDNFDNLFVFPNIVRFSWGTIESYLERAVKVEWPHEKDLDKADAPKGTQSITSFLQPAKPKQSTANKRKRHEFFTRRQMHHISTFMRFASSDSEDGGSDSESPRSLASLEDAVVQKKPTRGLTRREPPRQVSCARCCHGLTSISLVRVVTLLSLVASIPLTNQSMREISGRQVKLDALQQLRKQILSDHKVVRTLILLDKQAATAPNLFLDIMRREADWFALQWAEHGLWLKDEQAMIGQFLAGVAARVIPLQLLPVSLMPYPTLELQISSTKTKHSDISQRAYIAYVIDVTFNEMKWQVMRRYKEFFKLHEQLKIKYELPAASEVPPTVNGVAVVLPRLPPKHMFTPTSGEFVNKRRVQLEHYLSCLVSHPAFCQDVLLLSFLGVVSTARDREISKNEKNVIHITSLHVGLDYGDIILFSCRFGASIVQRKFTGKRFDHVGMVVPGQSRNLLRIIEATGEGIQVYSLKARLMAYAREVSKTIVVRRLDQHARTDETHQRLTQFVQRVEGNSYSIFGILQARGESERIDSREIMQLQLEPQRRCSQTTEASYTSDASSDATGSVVPSDASPTGSEGKASRSNRKYFCSSLIASAYKHVGWLDTTRSSSYFWPGSFEEGGEIDKYMAKGVQLGPETIIDCRIVEVGLARPEDKASSSSESH
ncbi:TPA: hypothetical protein N0F65_011284 [Lagenidium giganteum]|uniref:Ribonuclease n=1 Tax=Lagenidium giganteum TaxID=4803 RepID=A0AAV2YR37_9STRA|nr:TPA: hypothetical protein N0F65_011284 [Lagenidium giganteum]